MQSFRKHYGMVLEWVVMALMVILFAEVTLGIVFRAFGTSLVWYDEVASVLLAWLTFYGSALASVKRAHIGCPEIVEKMRPAAKRAFGILAQLLVIAFFALLAWVGFSIMPILTDDSLVSLPWVPMNFVMSVVPVSSVLILVAEVAALVELVRGGDVGDVGEQSAGGISLADGTH
jgi:TRAP-type C4-dicarboxylate transport system permease small subunit